MKHTLFTIFISVFMFVVINAQTSDTKETESKLESVRVFQLTPYGYISLPSNYWAFMDYDMVDAWGGIIESFDRSFRIRFSDGIIVSVFDGEDKNIVWKKELNTENGNITYALSENGQTKRVLAKIKGANFSAEVKNEAEIKRFLEIIKNYRTGKCEDCFNSRYTKRMKKYFERQSSKENE